MAQCAWEANEMVSYGQMSHAFLQGYVEALGLREETDLEELQLDISLAGGVTSPKPHPRLNTVFIIVCFCFVVGRRGSFPQ